MLASGVVCTLSGATQADQAAIDRGKYIFDAAGCFACHTDTKGGRPTLSGGPALQTPFGTFYAPNITPDPRHGIGRWSDQDFIRALREGVSPDGRHYYPVFPYTSYTKASERDLLDLKSYIFAQPPVAEPSRSHEIGFPFAFRPLLRLWKLLNFEAVRWRADHRRGEEWNRGSYLVEALSHCGECHTPRNILGGLDHSSWMAGAVLGNGKTVAPNLTPHESGLEQWSVADITFALELGLTPRGEILGGEMAEVIARSSSRLSAADRSAIAAYLKALPPLPSAVPTSGGGAK
ncbi:MAG TPA: cytochrome c [Alphaproteobacteria bacterium]|nr:cytochrome c [Alphaproteobacteria bacterium]